MGTCSPRRSASERALQHQPSTLFESVALPASPRLHQEKSSSRLSDQGAPSASWEGATVETQQPLWRERGKENTPWPSSTSRFSNAPAASSLRKFGVCYCCQAFSLLPFALLSSQRAFLTSTSRHLCTFLRLPPSCSCHFFVSACVCAALASYGSVRELTSAASS